MTSQMAASVGDGSNSCNGCGGGVAGARMQKPSAQKQKQLPPPPQQQQRWRQKRQVTIEAPALATVKKLKGAPTLCTTAASGG
eukprot:SAG31_NODE_38928_length_292_cov_0.808290_1_plen_82_part_10